MPTVIARHRLAPTGVGVMVRQDSHVAALDRAAMNAATTETPHRRKQRHPPTTAALEQAAALRGTGTGTGDVVIDLARYAAAAEGRNTLTPPTESPQPDPSIKETDQP